MEGARVLRDQLYPVKVNNARTDAVLQPNGDIKEDIVSALNDSNKTQVAKVSWSGPSIRITAIVVSLNLP